METLRLVRPTAAQAAEIEDYRAEFPADRARVTYVPERIPGLDHLERFESVSAWLLFCDEMQGRISWFLTLCESDRRIVGACCLRHRLEYDDDDPYFASHIGYSVRPGERGKGYGAAQLRLVLREASRLGIDPARIVCVSTNDASRRTILACRGVLKDSLCGEESGLTVNRYDVPTACIE